MKTRQKSRRAARQLLRLCLVNGQLDGDRARRTVRDSLAAHHQGTFGVLSEFLRLARIGQARSVARIDGAAAIPPEVRSQIESSLSRMYGRALEFEYGLDPALIGGVRIKVGSDVYDNSLKGRLAALGARFAAGTGTVERGTP